MSRKIRFLARALVLCCILTLLCTPAFAGNIQSSPEPGGIEPQYENFDKLSATLTISSRQATCTGKVTVNDDCTADLSMELLQDGTSIKDWTLTNQTGTFSLSKNYFITSGHTYQVKVTVTVYNAAGRVIETESAYSARILL